METLQMEKLKELVVCWRDAVARESQLLSDVKNIDDVLHEPALDKHMACISDRILTRQCCILELQNLMLVEQGKQLEAMSA